ncbi:GNAT family N-acetyltransferase [bacterium]|nr:GNAT family N-acetyltransferase [bacterium]
MEFNLQPTLTGNLIELRPLLEADFEALYQVASDPLIWEQHPSSDRYKENVFREFFQQGLASNGALIVIDRKNLEIIGSSRFFGYDPIDSRIEIGWTFLARSHWGGTYNRELKTLMLSHAFQFVEKVIFLIGPNNMRSRKAIQKIGASYLGKQVDPKGKESVVYQISKAEFYSS